MVVAEDEAGCFFDDCGVVSGDVDVDLGAVVGASDAEFEEFSVVSEGDFSFVDAVDSDAGVG